MQSRQAASCGVALALIRFTKGSEEKKSMAGIKQKIMGWISRSSYGNWFVHYLNLLAHDHNQREKKHITSRKEKIYFIIGYEDLQRSGWTVWERVVLYNCIYAADHGMIPVVDMRDHPSIYQEEKDFGKVNVWDTFYEQPAGVSLEEALASGNYVLADISHEWFTYIRMRKPNKINEEDYLRENFAKYIRLKPSIAKICEERLASIIPDKNPRSKLLGICIRGTDYKTFHHMKQPNVTDVMKEAVQVFHDYHCDYYFIATEDKSIFESVKTHLPNDKLLSYNAGTVDTTCGGLIGNHIREQTSAYNAGLDYITTLYILNRCSCLIGGLCGATIVAKYRKNPAYEYVNVIDKHASY